MSHNLTPAAVTNPSTTLNSVTVPDAGDPRTAASVVTPIQTLLNLCNYVFNVLVGNVALDLNINGHVNCNGLTSLGTTDIQATQDVRASRDVNATRDLNASRNCNVTGQLITQGTAIFSGGAQSPMRLRSPKIAVAGATTGTTTHYDFANYDRIWNAATATSGCAWQIDGAAVATGEEMTVFHSGSNSVQIKDPTGTTILTLSYTTGNIYGATLRWNGSGLDIVYVSMHS